MTYTDDHALALLAELARYYNVPPSDFDPYDPTKVTVSELAGDLIDSLPRSTQLPRGVEALRADALTRHV